MADDQPSPDVVLRPVSRGGSRTAGDVPDALRRRYLTEPERGGIAFYVDRVHRAQGGELPEDVLTADIDDGDPEMGEFSPWSWWPLVLAFSAALGMIGLAVGNFLLPIAGAVFLVAIVGWVYEYYRGYFAR